MSQSMNEKQKRQSVQNESEIVMINNQASSLEETLPGVQNDTILSREDRQPDFRIDGTRNSAAQQTKEDLAKQLKSTKQLPPLSHKPGGSRQSLDKEQFLTAKDVPPKAGEDGADDSDQSQKEFAEAIQGYTQIERNKINNVIQIIKQSDYEKEQKVQQSEEIASKAKKSFSEIELKMDGAPFYFKELDRKFVVYDQCSLGIFDAKGWFRRRVVWLICWPWFDNFIIIMIAINSLLLAATDYSDRENLTKRNSMIEASGLIFTITFTLEAVIKIMAMGFAVHKNSYLRDPWNWLDFLVVCIGIIEFIPAIPAANLKALRTFRVLRPLRSINAFPSMRRLIGSLLASLPSLANAVVFMFFIFLLFGILGVQQFGGVLYQRCRYTAEPNKDPITGLWTDWPIVEDIEQLCSTTGQGKFKCPEPYFCGSPAQFQLDLESEVLQDQELISYGIVTFDNLLRALITIFQMITLEGWTDMMYNLSDASQAWMAILYFCLLVVVGSFFLLNVILAVIMDAFDQVDQNSAAQDAKKKKDHIALKRLYGIHDSADESSDDEKDQRDEQQNGSNVQNLAEIQNEQVSRAINNENSVQAPVGISISVPQSPNNLRAVAPLSVGSPPQSISQLQTKKKPKKGKSQIEIPERARGSKLLSMFFIVCTHNAFNITLTVCIVLNTALLAMDRHPIKPETQNALESLNGILSWIFFFEMVIKMIGLGIKDYSADSFNLFDCTVVIISFVDLIISNIGVEFNGGGAISALRAVRLLRVFKLARSWTSFRLLLEKMIITLKDIRNFTVLMLLFMFIYTLLGMELYAYKAVYTNDDLESVAEEGEDGTYPRANFNTFLTGFTTIFIVFIGEDWNASMYDHVRTRGMGAVFFFISLFILGNLVLLNLFLAILLKNFEEPPGKDEDEDEDVESTLTKIKNILTMLRKKICPCLSTKEDKTKDLLAAGIINKIKLRKGTKSSDNVTEFVDKEHSKVKAIRKGSVSGEMDRSKKPLEQNIFNDQIEANENRSKSPPKKNLSRSKSVLNPALETTFTISSLKKMEVQKQQEGKRKNIQLNGNSLYMMGPKNKIREICKKAVGHQHFDNLILFLIGFSTILLTLENPLDDPNGKKNSALAKIDIVVSTIFTIELLLKVAVYGFIINGPESYMLNPWNIMDFIIVCFSLISIIFSQVDLGIIKVLRMLRVLRPLRMISRNPGLRIAVQSLINAIPDIGNVLVVSLLFILLFAILGTNFYKGTFFSCYTENIPEQFLEKITDKFDCQDFGGEWVNVDQNFDNVVSSMITLFNVMTTEGWIGVMWSAVDSNEIDMQPIKNNKQNSIFFFILFMVVGSLFILNMFVGIVINVFNKEKETLQMNHLLTQTQSDWCDVLISCYSQKPLVVFSSTGNQIVDQCHKIATHHLFDTFIFVCILLNTVCLAMSWYNEPDTLAPNLETINLVFNIIYTIEFAIKFIAFGSSYFSDGWNNFDLIIVVSAWLGMIINSIEGLDIGSLTTVIRSFRISRIFKIIKKYKNLRLLFYTFIGAIPQLTNVGGLLFLLLFLYSVLGVFLFAEVQLQDNLNIHANFQTFGNALITLFRMSTGESWNMIMYDCARERSITFDCKKQTYEEIQRDGVQGCGSPGKAYPFFISFMVVVSFIFLNLFIAIILESFNTTQDEQGLQVSQDTLDKFNKFWSKFDPKGRGFIPVWQFPKLINLILWEEIKEHQTLKEDIKNGDADVETTKGMIFMFNLHQEEKLMSVSSTMAEKVDKLLSFQMEKEDKEDKKEGDEDEDEKEDLAELGINEEDNMVLEIRKLKMSPEERREYEMQKRAVRDMNKFIASLQIPCYQTIKYYYYYDILEALSRNLFQLLLTKARDEMLQEQPSHSARSPTMSSIDEDELDEADKVQREHDNDIKQGQLDQILLRLEQKGMVSNIQKYKDMQQLRAKRSRIVQDKLEQFGPERSIIDSSQVIGAYVIVKYFTRANNERKRRIAVAKELEEKENGSMLAKLPSQTVSDVLISQQIGEKTPVIINAGLSAMEAREQKSLSRNDSGPGNIQGKLQSDEKNPREHANSSRSYVISPLSSQL